MGLFPIILLLRANEWERRNAVESELSEYDCSLIRYPNPSAIALFSGEQLEYSYQEKMKRLIHLGQSLSITFLLVIKDSPSHYKKGRFIAKGYFFNYGWLSYSLLLSLFTNQATKAMAKRGLMNTNQAKPSLFGLSEYSPNSFLPPWSRIIALGTLSFHRHY